MAERYISKLLLPFFLKLKIIDFIILINPQKCANLTLIKSFHTSECRSYSCLYNHIVARPTF
ncbi:hypothetical protein DERP_005639 [Dermatophagoides pteronyssinus]|uniref:Uncharacterized protein n=1 Tax=Dermatophagoides pteronyssinus TaxID=6956 RepID=A0ABQ8J972_DERPT|nr:hypothetical protein DERP_005639 [Dermatophagoides pteronyssinus]